VTEILSIEHERVDDVPVIIGVGNQLGLATILDRHLGTHGLQQGLDNGQLALGWLGYILSQADHRKSAVQEWANDNVQVLGKLLGCPLRETEFNDDRLGGVLSRLSKDDAWAAIESELWAATVNVYQIEAIGVRLDSTTSYGYHQPQEEGIMQYGGHSKDHRPDLAQLKLMAAAAEPSGHLIACDVEAGQRADDPLYVPLIKRVRNLLGERGLLYAGDAKMAALATRAHLVLYQDNYVVPLPLTGTTAREFEQWVDACVEGEQTASLVWDGERLIAAGYEFERTQTAVVEEQSITWTERVLVVRSSALAVRQRTQLEKRLARAQAKLKALTPKPGRGKRQIREKNALQAAIDRELAHYDVQGLLTVKWKKEQTTTTRYKGPGRPGPHRPTYTETTTRYVITSVQRNEAAIVARGYRLGWRAYATNSPALKLPLAQAIVHFRGGWCVERDFHLVKDLPLGLSPLFVWKDDQIIGLVRLLTLALRLLTLIETQVRRGLATDQTALAGLYEGQPNRTTARPTGKRILRAFTRAKIALTRVELPDETHWHITPLLPLHKQILKYLHLPMSLYTDLAFY
jgi:transposase